MLTANPIREILNHRKGVKEMKRIKFDTYNDAAQMMMFAIEDGYVTAWNMTKAGYVRYHCARSGFWLDLNEAAFKAWKYRP